MTQVTKEYLDSALKPIHERITVIESTVASLKTEMNNVKTDISSIKTEMNSIKTEMRIMGAKQLDVESRAANSRLTTPLQGLRHLHVYSEKAQPMIPPMPRTAAGVYKLQTKLPQLAHLLKQYDLLPVSEDETPNVIVEYDFTSDTDSRSDSEPDILSLTMKNPSGAVIALLEHFHVSDSIIKILRHYNTRPPIKQKRPAEHIEEPKPPKTTKFTEKPEDAPSTPKSVLGWDFNTPERDPPRKIRDVTNSLDSLPIRATSSVKSPHKPPPSAQARYLARTLSDSQRGSSKSTKPEAEIQDRDSFRSSKSGKSSRDRPSLTQPVHDAACSPTQQLPSDEVLAIARPSKQGQPNS